MRPNVSRHQSHNLPKRNLNINGSKIIPLGGVMSQSAKEEFKQRNSPNLSSKEICHNLPKRNLNLEQKSTGENKKQSSQSAKEEFKLFI